jgi:gamma-glutamyltranspeptidase/glutathione hydrolase
MLEAGGNAFDAAVAAGFASAAAEPTLTSLGGGGFLLAHSAAGEEVLFDFFVDTPGRGVVGGTEPHFEAVTVRFPGADQVFHTGLGSAAVPGCLRGYLHVHERLGRLPLAEVVAPAAALARNGAELDAFHADTVRLLAPIVTGSVASRALFAPGGRLLAEGDTLFNPDLADLLEALPTEGDAPLYRGELAVRIAADAAEVGGLITRADLAAYRVIERSPHTSHILGARILTNPPPSFGGALVALALELLEGRDLGAFGSAEHLCALAETLAAMEARHSATLNGDDDRPGNSRGTTHVSVVDAEGNVAAMTTSNGEGSGYLVPGAGIMLNNMLGEDDLHPGGFHSSPPGLRVASMMAPTVALRDGLPLLALGSGGSKRIRSAITQVLLATLAFDLPLAEAVAAPRLHLGDERFEVEPGFDEVALAAVERSWPLNRWSAHHMYFGGVHAVEVPGQAVGDARRGGSGVVVG